MSAMTPILVPLTPDQISELVLACTFMDAENEAFVSAESLLNTLNQEPLTREQTYVRDNYGKCPACQSTDIVGDSVEINGNLAHQGVNCNECGAVWCDEYQLTRVIDAEGFDPGEPVDTEDQYSVLIKATVTSIKWDADNPEDTADLDDAMTVEVQVAGDNAPPDESDIEDAVSDAITNQTGFCHKGFQMTYEVAPKK
ncbi:hypothetical protein [Marinobacter sp. MBR-105]